MSSTTAKSDGSDELLGEKETHLRFRSNHTYNRCVGSRVLVILFWIFEINLLQEIGLQCAYGFMYDFQYDARVPWMVLLSHGAMGVLLYLYPLATFLSDVIIDRQRMFTGSSLMEIAFLIPAFLFWLYSPPPPRCSLEVVLSATSL